MENKHLSQATSKLNKINIGEVLRRTAHIYPEKEALVGKGELKGRITYREANRKTNQFTHRLHQAGVEKGDHIAVLSGNTINWPFIWIGIAKRGAISVPINPQFTKKRMKYEMKHSDIKYIISEDFQLAKVEEVTELLDSEVKILLSQGEDDAYPDFNEFINEMPADEPELRRGDRDIFQIIYTSGTTGKPKGVMHSHINFVFAALNMVLDCYTEKNTIFFHPFPFFHITAQSFLLGILLIGASLVFTRSWDPLIALKAIEDEKINYLWLIPSMYREILSLDLNSYDLSSLEYCGYSMAPMDEETLRKAIEKLDADFLLASGQTEVVCPTPVFPPEYQLKKEGNYWGIPATFTDAAIMDEKGELLPDGEVGEIVYRGPTVTEGLYKNEEATRERIDDGWWRSEDLGFVDEDGLIKFADRKKDIIKSGGENVSTIKVESALMAHPDVEETAVIGLPHRKWGEAVTAIVKTTGKKLTKPDLINYCKERGDLEIFEIPKDIIFIEGEFPKTETGKIQKVELRENYENYYD